ncbi:MAG: GspE/PulE family protein [Planctomycetota bacterium]|nr:GspE/PulE family protein [Planctomycetota bacterium]
MQSTPALAGVGSRTPAAPRPGAQPTPAAATARLDVDPSVAWLLSADHALRLRAAPLRRQGRKVVLGMLDPSDVESADEASMLIGAPVLVQGLDQPAFDAILRSSYGTTAAAMGQRLGGASPSDDESLISNLEAVEADDLHRMAEQPSLINLVNLLILEAVRARASDIHVEPFERTLCVKYRIDGVLVEQPSPPKNLQAAITSRVKIMGGMNIAERYAPQDGHVTLRYEGRKIDIRVSTVPTLYGESVVMRILDKESVRLDLTSLGMRQPDREDMARLTRLAHGMVLVTGPTGSGKTTTLYAALTMIADPTKKVLTIEDPVEYELPGVNQVPVNPKRGLSFASGLRSILRQDPDIIMVGEIRDAETAEIGVRAALTGHLLFSTLHTNNAPSAIGRLLDMGIEPFLLSSVLEGILGQRLGRRLCVHCTRPEPVDDGLRARLSPSELRLFEGDRTHAGQTSGGHVHYLGAGCDECDGTGYRRRVGFYELLSITSSLRAAIGQRLPAHELLRAAGPSFVSMRGDGLMKAASGETSVAEVFRATQDTLEGAAAAANSIASGATHLSEGAR